MLRFEMNIADRKSLVKRLGELTGEKPKYTGVPKCAYTTSQFTILKDGTLECAEDADKIVVSTLLSEGIIKSEDFTVLEETEQEGAFPTSESTVQEEPEIAETETANTEDEQEGLTVSVPLEGHDANSLRNLINLVYTRAGLLNKALGTCFRIDEDVVEELKELPETAKITEVMYCLGEDSVSGFEVTEDKITFGPMPDVTPERAKAFTELVSRMNKSAITQKRIQAKEVNDESEKYALRIWVIRLGMNGPEFKETRKVLMENLSGSAAFRNDEEKAKWTVRQAEKKAAGHTAEVSA